jgi:peptide/nickel transport system permease protein
MTGTPARRFAEIAGAVLLALIAAVAAAPQVFTVNPPDTSLTDRTYAPPTRLHIHDAAGWHAPFMYREVIGDRLERRYTEDHRERYTVRWFVDGHLASVDAAAGPLLWLGADAIGRDIASRVTDGAHRSLGVAVIGTCGALLLGALLGGWAGVRGGRTDAWLMTLADFVIVLPGAYLVLVLRGALPLVLSSSLVFWLLAALFALTAWPHAARGVRAIVATERARDYAEAARASGAGDWRLLGHLLPAARGFLLVEIVLMLPALLVAEATVSFLGLGFMDTQPSWGTMINAASSATLIATAPWLLAPAAALFLVVLGVHLVGGSAPETALVTSSRS